MGSLTHVGSKGLIMWSDPTEEVKVVNAGSDLQKQLFGSNRKTKTIVGELS